MPEIGIADKETLDKIDTNVGAKTDAASSTGSLHAKVRDAKNAINAGNSTVNTINTNVGAEADAASATGSLHAKVKDVKSAVSSVQTNMQKPRGLQKITYSKKGPATDSPVWTDVTVLNLTNTRGVLRFMSLQGLYTMSGSDKAKLEITVDGNVIVPFGSETTINKDIMYYLDGFFRLLETPQSKPYISFKSSLKIVVSYDPNWSGGTSSSTWFTTTMLVETE